MNNPLFPTDRSEVNFKFPDGRDVTIQTTVLENTTHYIDRNVHISAIILKGLERETISQNYRTGRYTSKQDAIYEAEAKFLEFLKDYYRRTTSNYLNLKTEPINE